MTATVREQVIQAVIAKLTPITGISVFRSRTEPVSRAASPAIIVKPKDDHQTQEINGQSDWALVFILEIFTRGAAPDSLADPFIAQAHQLLMADLYLGGLVYDLEPVLVSFEILEADQSVCVATCEYRARYRTYLQDQTTLGG